MKKTSIFILSALFIMGSFSSFSSDWPIFKGNIYFTGNNDEIIVKNNNLKWLFQADERVFNPIVSDGLVYFLDLAGNLYCLDEDFGKPVWRLDIKKIAARFKVLSRAAGKIKYPLIMGDFLILTDPIAIYAIDKKTGRVIWARTGIKQDKTAIKTYGKRGYRPIVDGIYSNPIILEGNIFYATRNMFITREIKSGHFGWDNKGIKTYSGFPTFYDKTIFTQSTDYRTKSYMVYCLESGTGKEIWSQSIEKPIKIFPPVVYKRKVYIPTNKSMNCLDLNTGAVIWTREYDDLITSNPSFTDRSILFSIGNRDILVIAPDTGRILERISVGPQTAPYYVTVRDQIYIAYNKINNVSGKRIPYGRVKAVNFSDKKVLWDYQTPFPGAVSQPISSGGILLLPAGNYVYAIGTEHYKRIIKGGDGFSVTKDDKKRKKEKPHQRPLQRDRKKYKKIKTRKMKLTVTDKNKLGIPAVVEIKKRERGRIVYQKRKRVDKTGNVEVPEGDDVELLLTSDGYLPKKVIINQRDKEKDVEMEKIERGKGFVIDNILFELNKAYLKKKSLDIIDKLIKLMKKYPRVKIEIRGHTDSTGKPSYNQKLSERRADSVREYMIKNGISPERLKAVGLGETKPIADNKSSEGRKKNRRTEFFFSE